MGNGETVQNCNVIPKTRHADTYCSAVLPLVKADKQCRTRARLLTSHSQVMLRSLGLPKPFTRAQRATRDMPDPSR